MRIGTGYDVHKLALGRDLIIGGVKIDYEKGLLGHSDADVLTHAIIDALLGAMSDGDIGTHFPDSDDVYKGSDSLKLLRYVADILKDSNYTVSNIDSTIIAQEPKMREHIKNMRQNIAAALGIDVQQVSVKSTTTENLGFEGKKQGIAAQAVCIIYKIQQNSLKNIKNN